GAVVAVVALLFTMNMRPLMPADCGPSLGGAVRAKLSTTMTRGVVEMRCTKSTSWKYDPFAVMVNLISETGDAAAAAGSAPVAIGAGERDFSSTADWV